MEKRIIVPFGVKKVLISEFNISYHIIDRLLIGAFYSDNIKKQAVRQRALELGGVEKQS